MLLTFGTLEYKTFWIQVLHDLEPLIKRALLITWFKCTTVLGKNDGTLVIGVPRTFFLDWHLENSQDIILEVVQKIDPEIQKIIFQVDGSLENPDDPRTVNILDLFPEKKKVLRKLPKKPQIRMLGGVTSKILNPKYTLDNFVVGQQNRLAHAACSAVANRPGENYNPLFIYGGVGLGKTHLLQATGNKILQNDPHKIIVYATSETFTNEVIDAIQKRKMNQFRDQYRKVDILMIDDIQFIANKDRTQEEFFHTFNSLYEENKQIIISSDHPPKELDILEERLRSRFEWGMIADVQMPDYETRLAILLDKLKDYEAFINPKVLDYIALNVLDSIRELEGVLMQVMAQYELEKITPTLNSVQRILKNVVKEKKMIGFESNEPKLSVKTFEELVEIVSEHYHVKAEEVIGPMRQREYMIPRQVAMYIAKEYLKKSLKTIGDYFGGRDHTSVMHAVKKIEVALRNDRQLMRDINGLKREMGY